MKEFDHMTLSCFEDPAENEAFLEWLILGYFGPVSVGGQPIFSQKSGVIMGLNIDCRPLPTAGL